MRAVRVVIGHKNRLPVPLRWGVTCTVFRDSRREVERASSEKYAWLNGVQAINKVVEVKLGEGGYVKYDVFIVR